MVAAAGRRRRYGPIHRMVREYPAVHDQWSCPIRPFRLSRGNGAVGFLHGRSHLYRRHLNHCPGACRWSRVRPGLRDRRLDPSRLAPAQWARPARFGRRPAVLRLTTVPRSTAGSRVCSRSCPRQYRSGPASTERRAPPWVYSCIRATVPNDSYRDNLQRRRPVPEGTAATTSILRLADLVRRSGGGWWSQGESNP
jgi:hypothetical protein